MTPLADLLRRERGIRPERNTADGSWFETDDRCAVCGDDFDSLARDHCHLSGLFRGWLCTACNMTEGRADDEPGSLWWHWRRTAPFLEVGRRRLHKQEWISGDCEELMTAPIEVILDAARDAYQQWDEERSRLAAERISSILADALGGMS